MGKFHSIKGLNLVEVISLLLNTPCTSEKTGLNTSEQELT